MALIILEGLDRTGKSSVAEHYKSKGYEVIHQSAPPRGMTADLYLEEQMQLVSSAASKNIVLDRSYYGELVWPQIYNRQSLLTEDALEILGELEESVGVERFLMHDPNIEAHWKRCVDNKEPLTRTQFLQARSLFNKMAEKYGFDHKTLADFAIVSSSEPAAEPARSDEKRNNSANSAGSVAPVVQTKEQLKLEKANAINDVLSKRILKSKGPIYDELESSIRTYLNTELGKIFGGGEHQTQLPGLTSEELEFLRFFAKKALKDTKVR